jgi:hypothetical protein
LQRIEVHGTDGLVLWVHRNNDVLHGVGSSGSSSSWRLQLLHGGAPLVVLSATRVGGEGVSGVVRQQTGVAVSMMFK